MIYLASPYSHSDPAVMQARYVAVCKAAAALLVQGHHVLSPIAHSRALCDPGGIVDLGFDQWAAYDFDTIRACGSFWILCLPGWRESKGVSAELQQARALGIPIAYVDPATLAKTIKPPAQYTASLLTPNPPAKADGE